jgi:hypothetical protein
MFLLLIYAGATTWFADFHIDAMGKWDWVWKAMVWAIFLPLTLRTKLRIEAYLLFVTLSAAAIIIVGGIKTAVSGGGYGALNLMVDNNSGLYEGSIISTVSIALIPVILWLARFGTIFPRDWRVRLFAYNLVFACLLIPVGTSARTGLICIAALGILLLRDAKNRFGYMALVAIGLAVAVRCCRALLPIGWARSRPTRADTSASPGSLCGSGLGTMPERTRSAAAFEATSRTSCAWTWYRPKRPVGRG